MEARISPSISLRKEEGTRHVLGVSSFFKDSLSKIRLSKIRIKKSEEGFCLEVQKATI